MVYLCCFGCVCMCRCVRGWVGARSHMWVLCARWQNIRFIYSFCWPCKAWCGHPCPLLSFSITFCWKAWETGRSEVLLITKMSTADHVLFTYSKHSRIYFRFDFETLGLLIAWDTDQTKEINGISYHEREGGEREREGGEREREGGERERVEKGRERVEKGRERVERGRERVERGRERVEKGRGRERAEKRRERGRERVE